MSSVSEVSVDACWVLRSAADVGNSGAPQRAVVAAEVSGQEDVEASGFLAGADGVGVAEAVRKSYIYAV